ncbi:MAG TPA: hypothetical protein DDZ80_19025, partial [Cyanobacteria bacterium UBA8803]|nr:hypothetical protein [Cyanobacteria bacterium UBA8803]
TPKPDSHQQKDHTLANSSPPNPSDISLTKSAVTEADPVPDWIETQATPTGYVKHPLERVLEWLDLGMLWLEELLIKLWRWVRRFWRRL